MISKEKLLNGYIKTNDRELVRLFLSECLKYEDINLPTISFRTFTDWEHFAVSDSGTPCSHGPKVIKQKEELTLEDFKSKTESTLELVKDLTTTDIARAMLDGEIFYNKDGLMAYSWDGEDFVDSLGRNISIWANTNFYRLTNNF